MFSDLPTFTTPKFQRASMMVALLQIVLKQGGNTEEASRLEGLEVTTPAMARVAIEILTGMHVQGAELSATRTFALTTLHEALRSDASFSTVSAN